jgi:uncharacterized protein (TIGR00730 family)
VQQFPPKAYDNAAFLHAPQARAIRILCEYEETRLRLQRERVRDTIVFFGSARLVSTEDADRKAEAALAASRAEPGDLALARAASRAERLRGMARYYEEARSLARRLTEWSMGRGGKRAPVICSGGGPGIMEAANRGAREAGGRTVGLGISLPFEQGVNAWVTPELSFEFHYFFTRKFWFLNLCRALVIFPGGFGTLDELFETLTLVQTGKIARPMPIVLYGRDYWSRVLNLDVMVEHGTISEGDIELMRRVDSVDEAYDYLTSKL